MTSYRQIDANRRNACNSTGPTTEEGKRRSRCNAVRHGLTAETVIGALEDAKDYQAFEAAIIADYDAQSAVERELVLRLASLLWRLRRATTMETGLLEIQADHLRQVRQISPASRDVVYAMFRQADVPSFDRNQVPHGITGVTNTPLGFRTRSEHGGYSKREKFFPTPELPLLAPWMSDERAPEQIEQAHRDLEKQARKELGNDWEFVSNYTIENMFDDWTVIERLDAMIDRCVKRLLMVRGVKSMSISAPAASSNRKRPTAA